MSEVADLTSFGLPVCTSALHGGGCPGRLTSRRSACVVKGEISAIAGVEAPRETCSVGLADFDVCFLSGQCGQRSATQDLDFRSLVS